MVHLDRVLVRPTATLAYTDHGVGDPAVVLTHGAGLDHSMFEDQAAALAARGVRVIRWDLRGHGRSTLSSGVHFTAGDALEDLAALIAECGVSAPVLVGHSLGGNLVQTFVRAHPHRAAGVIVLDSAWNTGPLSQFEQWALRAAAPALSLVPARRLPGLMARASAETPEAIARTRAVFAQMPKPRFLDVWRATTTFVAPEPGYRSPVPIALVRGARDRTGNIATAMGRWAAAEGVSEHVIPAAGHLLTWDAPQAVSAVITDILDGWGLLAARTW